MAPILTKNRKFPKVIVFTADTAATDADYELANDIGPGVVFRNAYFVPENPSPGSLETCDFVAAGEGVAIPKPYADRFPVWGETGEDVSEISEQDPNAPTSETGTPVDPATNQPVDTSKDNATGANTPAIVPVQVQTLPGSVGNAPAPAPAPAATPAASTSAAAPAPAKPAPAPKPKATPTPAPAQAPPGPAAGAWKPGN